LTPFEQADNRRRVKKLTILFLTAACVISLGSRFLNRGCATSHPGLEFVCDPVDNGGNGGGGGE